MTQQVNSDFVGSYVSFDCPNGDIELELCGDGSCTIQKRLWDEEKMQHTDTISKSGVWTSQAGALELDFGDLQLRYRWNAGSPLSIAGAETNIAGWAMSVASRRTSSLPLGKSSRYSSREVK